MPRGSRHKSSKHSSRDARDYSDSEDDSSLKERKASEDGNARVAKDSGLGEKRKVDSKDGKELCGSGNGEYLDEYSSSKRRKEKMVDGVSDRWNGGGGEADERGGDSSKKAKGVSESKSRRRDDEIEEMKKSGGKSEKHKEMSRKEGRENERRGREAKGEKSGDNEEGRSSKREITTESKADAAVQNPDSLSESLLEGRGKRRRDDSADWSKYQDDIGEGKNRHASSVEDAAKDVRRKDEKQRDDRYRDRYREEVDRDSKNRVEKKKDEFPAKDRTGSKSNDKYLKDDRDNSEARQKKSKPHDGLREHDIDSARDHDHDREQDKDRDRDRDREHDQDGYRSRDRIRSGERDRNSARDKERDREWEHDHDRDRDRDREWEVELAHHDDRSIKYKDRRGRKRSPDDHDDYSDSKIRSSKAHNSDSEKRSLSGSKVEADGRVGSQSRQTHAEITVSSSRHRASPTSSLHGGTDEHRHVRQDDLKYRDLPIESRLKTTERGPKYRSLEKPSKMDDGHYMELSGERSSSSKASPMGLVERSPSSPSLERRHMHRSSVRRSLDVEEQGRSSRASADTRDVSVGEGRFSRDIPSDKQLLDDSAQADSSFYNRPGQRSSSIPPPPFRAGVESPTFMGMEEDSRNNLNARYKRSGDLSLGRGPVNNWRSVPNWSSPVPNGFMPFQHGPPHGNFPGLMAHFPSPPLFGVRPAMDMNQPGLPYPMADTDRFPGHMRPLGWPNMIDASGPPRLHGWDVNSGALRNEPPIYAGPDWDHGRHPMSSRGWETNADMWKGHSSVANVDLPSTSHKESIPALFPANESSSGQGTQKPTNEDSHELVQAKVAEIKASVASSEKEIFKPSAETAGENKTDSSKLSESNECVNISRFYLSKLDISGELVHSEVYQCCMNLLDGEPCSTVDEDPITRVILKNHSRLETKALDGSLSGSLLPARDDSIFKRAMDLYKKERLESRDIAMSKGGLLDFVLSTTLSKAKEQERVCQEVEKEEPAHTVEGRIQSPTLAADQVQAKAILSAVGEEKLGDSVAISRMDVSEPILTSSKKSGQVHKGQGYLGEHPIGLYPGEEGDLIHMAANLDDACADHILSGDHAPQAAAVLPIDDSGRELAVKTASDHVSEESGDFGNKVGDSLVVDGPSSTHEASMPGSNESQLVNLSRIHHSPESTH